jgi:threonine synthase
VFACASTGNLANSVAAHAARLGLSCSVFIPDNLEIGKVTGAAVYRPRIIAVRGNYDDVNRLCTQVADRYHWGFANINLRAYYAEGAKTYGFEIAEQLGWRFPRHVVSPVAGGTLLPRILKGFTELREVGLVGGELPRIHAAQSAGCAPVVRALEEGLEYPEPVKPDTLAKSIAIGNPADGFQVLRAVRATGGGGAMVSEEEIIQGIQLLAETEGIFTEPAGGVTVAATRQLVQRGAIDGDGPVVICVTGNGYKTAEVLTGRSVEPIRIGRSLAEFEAIQSAPAEV